MKRCLRIVRLAVPFSSAPSTDAPEYTPTVFQQIIRLPVTISLLLLQLYQRTLSPALPVFFGSTCGCRFSPTCSHYAAEAIRTHGAVVGIFFSIVRLVKCTPLHPGGHDPVPPKRSALRCERVSS